MKKYNTLKTITVAGIASLSLTSCNKFLEEMPSKNSSLPLETVEQLDMLLNKYVDFAIEPNRPAYAGHDDLEISKQVYDTIPALFYSLNNLRTYIWEYDDIKRASSDQFWGGNGYRIPGEYGKIFRANMILEALPRIAMSEQDRLRISTEAHLIRAYSYWALASTYCLPYSSGTKNEQGLPLKTSTSFEQSLERKTLEETYQLIESDLQEALKTNVSIHKDGKLQSWRASVAAANGFAARFYLYQGSYELALQHAQKALQDNGQLFDYNTEMGTTDLFGLQMPSIFAFDESDYTQRIKWKEALYMRFLYAGSVVDQFLPSSQLLNLYDQEHDLRYHYHMINDVFAMWGTPYDYPMYATFSFNHVFNGPSTAEMYLIEAECLARQGQFAPAMDKVNQLRAKRMKPGVWVNLKASNQEEALKHIREERRREMPLSQRWNDIRRYNFNEDPNDDVRIERHFYSISSTGVLNKEPIKTYVLEGKSRKFAYPINENEIQISNGQIKQNTY